ncbi:hypothetical protein RXV94_03645 [Yeosuana sp. MJ-SS3]|uniref:Uncharacterized protein n=1 Tax=Gilvirhabdus luticola TaxID=3079858 RepID=A0ABU3U544_9FLAO|nr:hypothetical protein [Yeosuana sp. MJ-SS3]MDU8885240.1 hypothetical protein [Yeosuana sp. MJ-SS3]
MPLGESFLSTLRSNKAIMLDKTKRFRKTKGTFGDITKEIIFDYHNATPQELELFKNQLKKVNRIRIVKAFIITIIILAILVILFVEHVNL